MRFSCAERNKNQFDIRPPSGRPDRPAVGKGVARNMQEKQEILIVIPAYNEAENIERVVDDLIANYPQ